MCRWWWVVLIKNEPPLALLYSLPCQSIVIIISAPNHFVMAYKFLINEFIDRVTLQSGAHVYFLAIYCGIFPISKYVNFKNQKMCFYVTQIRFFPFLV